MATLRSDEDADLIFELLYGAPKFRFLEEALKLDIFQSVDDVIGGVTSEKLARDKGFSHRPLSKLLDCLTSMGLLKKTLVQGKENEQNKYVYFNTRATKKYLINEKPGSLSPLVPFIDIICRKTEKNLPVVIKNGIQDTIYDGCLTAWQKKKQETMSLDTIYDGCFTAWQRKKQESMSLGVDTLSADHFGYVMDGFTQTCVDAIVDAFDFSHHKVAIDIGGGFGLLAENLKRRYPEMNVGVFNFDHIIKMGKDIKADAKLDWIAGDFFKDKDLPPADLFVLCHVIENWSDEHNHCILEKAYRSLPQGGQILLVEKFLSEDKTQPPNPVIANLMGAIIGIEGDYRTEQDYAALLVREGFVSICSRRISGFNDHDVMLASKPRN